MLNQAIELTGRETQILHLLAEGLDVPQIANKLVVSPTTISIHLNSISRKLATTGADRGLTQRVQVQEDGHVEVDIPQIKAGEVIDVTVSAPLPPRPIGLLKGKIHIHDNFDEPLEEFSAYL